MCTYYICAREMFGGQPAAPRRISGANPEGPGSITSGYPRLVRRSEVPIADGLSAVSRAADMALFDGGVAPEPRHCSLRPRVLLSRQSDPRTDQNRVAWLPHVSERVAKRGEA